MKTSITGILAAVATALILTTAPALATSITTNDYSATSVSEDIAESCKGVSISTTGNTNPTVSAACNKKDSNGDVVTNSTTLNLGSHIWCSGKGVIGTFTWGQPPANTIARWYPVSWAVELDSTGDNYTVTAKCADSLKIKPTTAKQELDLGDTTNGLKNDSGSLAKR